MCKECSDHREEYRSHHLAMTDLGFDGTKDLRPTVKKKAFGKFNPREGDSVDTSALDMAEIARMLEEARKTASG